MPSPELVQSSSESCSVLNGNGNTISERTSESFSQNQHVDTDCDLSGKHHAADCFSADLEMSESAVNEQHLHADSKFIENFSSSNHSDEKFRALSVGHTFNSFEDLYNLAEDYASTHYFKLAKSVTYDTDTNDAEQDANTFIYHDNFNIQDFSMDKYYSLSLLFMLWFFYPCVIFQ